MRFVPALARAVIAIAVLPAAVMHAQNQQPQPQPQPQAQPQAQQGQSDTPTFRITSTLVFLDVTVLDKHNHPVVTGLTKDDFTITEDKKPQRIFSFEAPESHVIGSNGGDENPDGKAPVTILVLDMLNSRFQDFAYIRYEVRKYLMTQPAQLASPAELLVVRDNSLEMLQGYTRSREDLLYALDHLPAALPFKLMDPAFIWERFAQSIDALQQIAMQNTGVPGRKNVVWVGHGGPGIFLEPATLTEQIVEELKQYAHETTNMLVDARISLFVIYPGLSVRGSGISISGEEADVDLGEDDPFSGDIDFGVFANETGGKLFFNRNDVAKLVARSEQMGADYYTLTYQPTDVGSDGKFRRVRVTLKDRNLHVVTKAGYFAPDKNTPVDPRQQSITNISQAVISTIPFTALDVTVGSVLRHPDTRTVDLKIHLKDRNLSWQPTEDGRYRTTLLFGAVSLNKYGEIVSSRTERVNVTTPVQDPVQRAAMVTPLPITLRLPRKAQDVRVAVECEEGGRMGTAELSHKAIMAAPVAPTPVPQLVKHRPEYVRPGAQ